MAQVVTSPILVRLARPEDDQAIGEILIRAFVEGYARKMPEVVVTDERKADLRNVAEKRRTGAVMVAEMGSRVVGSLTLYKPGAPRSEAWTPNAADLRFLGIDQDLRGKGVAEAMLDAAERWVLDWGCDSICLHVRRGAHGVARLYTNRGYVREPEGDLDLPTIYLEAYRLILGRVVNQEKPNSNCS